MKTILVTGSNGLLGQKLTDLYLQKSDRKLIATAKGENRHPSKSGYIYEEADITDHGRMRELVEKYHPDAIIHTAAMTNVDACETQQELCRALNIDAVRNLAVLSAEFKFRLIHISTDFIFDGTHPMYEEDETANPVSYYGWSKWEGEKMVKEHAEKWAILRTAIVYGVVSDMSRSNIVLWAYNTLKNGSAAKVVNDQFRTPTLAEDLAMGCFLAEEQDAQGIYNICGPDFMGIHELVERIALHFGFETGNISFVKSPDLNQPAKRPPITGLDITKARRELGYRPHTFTEGLDLVAAQAGFSNN